MFTPVRNSVGSVAPAYLTPALINPITSLLVAAFTMDATSLAVPIVLAFCNVNFLPKTCYYNYPKIVKSIPWILMIYIAYSVFLFMYMNDHNMFITKYLNTQCSSICRLNWFDNVKSYMATILFVLYVLLYIIIMQVYMFYDPRLPLQYINSIVLIIALLYTFFILKLNITPGISVLGSIWCFFAVFMGPYVLYFVNS